MQIDHLVIVDIYEQILITTINFIIRMDIKFVCTFQFLSHFDLNIRYKLNKKYVIFDALFKLISLNFTISKQDHTKLNVLFIYNSTFVEMFKNFYKKIVKNYFNNLV